jgi:hypothetical protein
MKEDPDLEYQSITHQLYEQERKRRIGNVDPSQDISPRDITPQKQLKRDNLETIPKQPQEQKREFIYLRWKLLMEVRWRIIPANPDDARDNSTNYRERQSRN